MHPQLTYLIAQQRSAELHSADAWARLVRDVPARPRGSRRSRRIARLIARLVSITGRFAPTGP